VHQRLQVRQVRRRLRRALTRVRRRQPDDDDRLLQRVLQGASCGDGMVRAGRGLRRRQRHRRRRVQQRRARPAGCGDGVRQAGVEECDDGNAIDTDACLSNCKPAKLRRRGRAGRQGGVRRRQQDRRRRVQQRCKLAATPAATRPRTADETDVDCGGDLRRPAAIGKKCGGNDDCASGQCKRRHLRAPLTADARPTAPRRTSRPCRPSRAR
jgi:cysteine-rich repeat protein